MWHVASSCLTRDETGPLHWEHGVLAPGPPGKPPVFHILLSLLVPSGVDQCIAFTLICSSPEITMDPYGCLTHTKLINSELMVWAFRLHLPCPLSPLCPITPFLYGNFYPSFTKRRVLIRIVLRTKETLFQQEREECYYIWMEL